ncbi:MAG: hypothetical protein E4G90_08790 [Gemmatimonadales bacterium]|nr:MAG: hypothetical protein E4G90_08790 [Gemmatimonadales bacterium]
MSDTTLAASTRLPYIDHLRVSLVILVVLHHVAVVYVAAVPTPSPEKSGWQWHARGRQWMA